MRRNLVTRVVVAAVALFGSVSGPRLGVGADATKTAWLSQARWGVMTHYLGAPPSSAGGAELTAEMWNAQVDAFDVDGLAEQLASAGAKYLLFTIGQNSGHFCAPNATYDKIVGINPSKCSRRDLIADLAKSLKAGNPDALVAFNPGVLVPVVADSKHEDYAAGEVNLEQLPRAVAQCQGRWLPCEGSQVQFHILTFLGSSWCRGDRPQESDEKIIGYTRQVAAQGGAITYDVPIQKSGLIPQPFVDQLHAIRRAMR